MPRNTNSDILQEDFDKLVKLKEKTKTIKKEPKLQFSSQFSTKPKAPISAYNHFTASFFKKNH